MVCCVCVHTEAFTVPPRCRSFWLRVCLSVCVCVSSSEFGRYAGRVRFESSRPTENSALLILSTEESDGGRYTCHISTFPNGNFERRITLTVWGKRLSLYLSRSLSIALSLCLSLSRSRSRSLSLSLPLCLSLSLP